MRVLIVPEDFRNDQYILKPLFQRLFEDIERRAQVRVCKDPLLGGVNEALKLERVREVLAKHRGMMDMIVLCIDRDGDTGRRQRLDQIEEAIESEFGAATVFLAQEAWEEIETWVLAGLDPPSGWRWNEVRAEIHVKERCFDVLAAERGVAGGLGGGRKALVEEAARNLPAIRRKCPEDFDALALRVETAAASAA